MFKEIIDWSTYILLAICLSQRVTRVHVTIILGSSSDLETFQEESFKWQFASSVVSSRWIGLNDRWREKDWRKWGLVAPFHPLAGDTVEKLDRRGNVVTIDSIYLTATRGDVLRGNHSQPLSRVRLAKGKRANSIATRRHSIREVSVCVRRGFCGAPFDGGVTL